jgi:hypothetical protein
MLAMCSLSYTLSPALAPAAHKHAHDHERTPHGRTIIVFTIDQKPGCGANLFDSSEGGFSESPVSVEEDIVQRQAAGCTLGPSRTKGLSIC